MSEQANLIWNPQSWSSSSMQAKRAASPCSSRPAKQQNWSQVDILTQASAASKRAHDVQTTLIGLQAAAKFLVNLIMVHAHHHDLNAGTWNDWRSWSKSTNNSGRELLHQYFPEYFLRVQQPPLIKWKEHTTSMVKGYRIGMSISDLPGTTYMDKWWCRSGSLSPLQRRRGTDGWAWTKVIRFSVSWPRIFPHRPWRSQRAGEFFIVI